MAKYGSTGNDANMGETVRFLERQGKAGGGRAGAYQIEQSRVTAPGVRDSMKDSPMPHERADKPGV